MYTGNDNSDITYYTFEETAKQWLKLKEINTKPSTIVKYRNALEQHILPELGSLTIPKLNTWDVEKFALHQLQQGRIDGHGGLSVQSVKGMLGIIGAVIRYAEKRNVYSTCRINDIQIKSNEKHVKIISPEMQNQLEHYLLSHATPKNVGILMSLYMGIRIGELCALKWESIDLDDQIIHIRATMQRLQIFSEHSEHRTEVITTTPKSISSLRDLPIPGFILKLLKNFSDVLPEKYFLSDDTEKFIEPRNFQRYFKKILKITNMEDINYHALRHTFATRCIEEGFDMKSLSEILGHSSINITMNRYVHPSMEQKRKNMLKLDKPLSEK